MGKIEVRGNYTFMGVTVPVICGAFAGEQKGLAAKSVADIHHVALADINSRIRKMVERNKFQLGVDYIDLNASVARCEALISTLEMKTSPNTKNVFLVSEIGYTKLVADMDNNESWMTLKQLADGYFRSTPAVVMSSPAAPGVHMHDTAPAATVNPALPLSREELAAYMLYNERHTDAIEKMMESFMNNQTTIMKNFIETQKTYVENVCTSLLSSVDSLDGTMKKYVNNTPAAFENRAIDGNSFGDLANESREWKLSALNRAARSCKEYGVGRSSTVLRKVYKLMNNTGKVNLDEERAKYMTVNNLGYVSLIDVVSANADLRKMFDEKIEEVMDVGIVDVVTPTSTASTPAHMRQQVAPLIPGTFKTQTAAMRAINKKIEETAGISLKNITENFRDVTNNNKACVSYVISQDKRLMKLFTDVVNSLLHPDTALAAAM